MNRFWMSGAAAVMALSVAGVQAQTQDPQTPKMPAAQSATADMQTTTLKGCVYKEADVPGRAPNVAERAGVLEDYILVTSSDAAMDRPAGTSGTTPPATAPPAATPPATQQAKAYKLEHAADDKLSAMVGKMVEVTGKKDADDRAVGTSGAPAKDKVPGNPDTIELPEFEVTTIREVEGTCPAMPNLPKRK